MSKKQPELITNWKVLVSIFLTVFLVFLYKVVSTPSINLYYMVIPTFIVLILVYLLSKVIKNDYVVLGISAFLAPLLNNFYYMISTRSNTSTVINYGFVITELVFVGGILLFYYLSKKIK